LPVLRVAFQGKSLEEFAQLYHSHVSSLGMFIRTADLLPVGTRLTFEFTLEDGQPILNGRAVVVWVTEDTGNPELPPGIELRFEWMPSDSRRCFEWLLLYKRGAALGLPELPVPPPRPPAAAPADPQRLPAVRRPGPAAGATGPSTRELIVDGSALGGDKPAAGPQPQGSAGPGDPVKRSNTDPEQLFNSVDVSWDDTDRWTRRSKSPRSSDPDAGRLHSGRRWLILGAVVAVVLVLGIICGYRALRDSSEANAPRGLRLLRLATEPSGAEVLVDGLPAGKTPLEVPVKMNSRFMLRFGEAGETREIPLVGQHWTREGEVEVLELRIPLLPAPPPASAPAHVPAGGPAATPSPKSAANPDRTKPARRSSAARPAAGGPAAKPAVKGQPAPAVDQPSVETKQPAKPPAKQPGQQGAKVPDWAGE
jgi:uncharacterized protein (TIGR02266 family)